MLRSRISTIALLLQCFCYAVDGSYYTIDDTLYFLEENTRVPWSEAWLDCERKSMTLVSFETPYEFQKIIQFLYNSPHDLLWIWSGGNRTANTSRWTWDAGTSINTFAWGEFQPDLPPGEGACINFNGNYKAWDDDDCNLRMAYMCEQVHQTVEMDKGTSDLIE